MSVVQDVFELVIYDSVDAINETINNFFQAKLNEDAVEVNASRVGLDPRAGLIWVGSDYIAVNNRNNGSRILDYYGGFEYVNKEYICTIGDWKVYTSDEGDSNRVQDALDYFHQLTD